MGYLLQEGSLSDLLPFSSSTLLETLGDFGHSQLAGLPGRAELFGVKGLSVMFQSDRSGPATVASQSIMTSRYYMDSENRHDQSSRSHQLERASSEASSSTDSTSGSSETTDHPSPAGLHSSIVRVKEEDEKKTDNAIETSTGCMEGRLPTCVRTAVPILAERSVADGQPAACLITSKSSGCSRGKRKGRQGQKSKEAYNRKRRDKKKQERRERAAAARQLTLLGHAAPICKVAVDAVRA